MHEAFLAGEVIWDSGPAFDSTDPHLIPVPEDAQPGRWRVCAIPDMPTMSAVLEVASGRSWSRASYARIASMTRPHMITAMARVRGSSRRGVIVLGFDLTSVAIHRRPSSPLRKRSAHHRSGALSGAVRLAESLGAHVT